MFDFLYKDRFSIMFLLLGVIFFLDAFLNWIQMKRDNKTEKLEEEV